MGQINSSLAKILVSIQSKASYLLTPTEGKKLLFTDTYPTVYTVLCTLYTVHCTLYTIYCTVYTVHCILYTVQCTLYT